MIFGRLIFSVIWRGKYRIIINTNDKIASSNQHSRLYFCIAGCTFATIATITLPLQHHLILRRQREVMHKLLRIDFGGEVEEVGVEHLAFFVNADVKRGLA